MRNKTKLRNTVLTSAILAGCIMFNGCTTFGQSLGRRAQVPVEPVAPVIIEDDSDPIEQVKTVKIDQVLIETSGLAVDPNNPEQLIARALQMSREGRYATAERLFAMVQELSTPGTPFQRSCLFARANLLMRINREPEGIKLLEQIKADLDAIAISELNTQERVMLGLADAAAGRPYRINSHPEEITELFQN